MATRHLISITDFCGYHQIEHSFIHTLHEAGLVKIDTVDKTPYIPETELQKLERMIRLHHELEINVAGIEAISHLLQRVESLNEDIRTMRNKLLFYERDK
jgi:chaperone modulatory protein CbpM